MFPVKHVRAMCATLLGLALASGGLSACGYHPVRSSGEPAGRLRVVAAPALAPDAEALHAALAGARAELGREGVLAGGGATPRLVLELVRVDAEAQGIVARSGRPAARGLRVSVVVRAWVEERAGEGPQRVTGDVERGVTLPEGVSGADAASRRLSATRQAGEAAGRAAARSVLGIPTAGQDQ